MILPITIVLTLEIDEICANNSKIMLVKNAFESIQVLKTKKQFLRFFQFVPGNFQNGY